MIQQKVDYLFLSATAATLQVAVLVLKLMRRSEVGNTTEVVPKVPSPA